MEAGVNSPGYRSRIVGSCSLHFQVHQMVLHCFPKWRYSFFCCCLLFIFLLAMPHSSWDLSFPTRAWTWALGSDSVESQPLSHQGIPNSAFLIILIMLFTLRVKRSCLKLVVEFVMIWEENCAFHLFIVEFMTMKYFVQIISPLCFAVTITRMKIINVTGCNDLFFYITFWS